MVLLTVLHILTSWYHVEAGETLVIINAGRPKCVYMAVLWVITLFNLRFVIDL